MGGMATGLLVMLISFSTCDLVSTPLGEGFPHSLAGKESTCNAGDPSSIPGSGRSSGAGIGDPFRYSWASLIAQLVKNYPQHRTPGVDPWVGKILWSRAWQPTLVFWPGFSMDYTDHGDTKSQARLSDFQFHFHPWERKTKATEKKKNCNNSELSRRHNQDHSIRLKQVSVC